MKKFSFAVLLFSVLGQAQVFNDGGVLQPLGELKLEDVEISTYLPEFKKAFAIGGSSLYEIDLSSPEDPKLLSKIDLPLKASSITSHNNSMAISFPGEGKESLIHLYTFSDSLVLNRELKTCSNLDMITFTPNGEFIVGACEGTPRDDFKIDPEGGILLLSMKSLNNSPEILRFNHLDSLKLLANGVRKSGPSSFFASLEPEYVTISEDSKKAWVSLQENNAMAKVDLKKKEITDIFPLGALDHRLPENAIVISSKKEIKRKPLPVLGLRQPDGIAYYSFGDNPYILTANEGADMDYSVWKDGVKWEKRLEGEKLDPSKVSLTSFQDSKKFKLAKDECIRNKKGECVAFYSFGSRSISIFDGKSGKLLWDSGNLLEKKMEVVAPSYFNWNSKKNKVKVNARSSSKGIEPENVTIGQIGSKMYAFVALERMSGIAVFQLFNQKMPQYRGYYMNPEHRGPEGLFFVSAEKSPIKKPLLIVCYEYSGTFSVYQIP